MASSPSLGGWAEAKLKQLEEQFRALFLDVVAKGEASDDSLLRIDVYLTTSKAPSASLPEPQRLLSEDIELSGLVGTPAQQRLPFEDAEVDCVGLAGHDVRGQAGAEKRDLRPIAPGINASHIEEAQDLLGRSSGGESTESSSSEASSVRTSKRRKATGGLRLPPGASKDSHDDAVTVRKLHCDTRYFPKRKRGSETDQPALKPSSLDRLVEGIWSKIHCGSSFDITQLNNRGLLMQDVSGGTSSAVLAENSFRKMNILCRDITGASQTCRAIELIVQARWIDHFNARMQDLATNGEVKNMKLAIAEASQDFGWTEKYLRNRMAIWHGYHQIKEAGGWVSLIFSGAGIYRYCKYRVSFDNESMQTLQRLRDRFELAADTIHPNWRQLLTIVGEPAVPRFTGHPLDWVVSLGFSSRDASSSRVPVPLAQTYVHSDPDFFYRHIEKCEIDREAWGDLEPRHSSSTLRSGQYHCIICDKSQSDDVRSRECQCYPEIFGACTAPCPVQVFQTSDGRNNGLLACCQFARGTAIGEFVGLVTAGLKDLDTMEGKVEDRVYQIWQGREGNYTRFVNHSCRPNAQFERFFWLGVERVILVSKGIGAGAEITVDYSDSYWRNLEKVCLCGSTACRYQDRNAR